MPQTRYPSLNFQRRLSGSSPLLMRSFQGCIASACGKLPSFSGPFAAHGSGGRRVFFQCKCTRKSRNRTAHAGAVGTVERPGHSRLSENSPDGQNCMPLGRCCLTPCRRPCGAGCCRNRFCADQKRDGGLALHKASVPITALWGVRRARELCASAIPNEWARHPNVRCIAIGADNLDNEWNGHHGELIRALVRLRWSGLGPCLCQWLTGHGVFRNGHPCLNRAT